MAEQNQADRYLELCMKRVRAWELARPNSRTEHEMAEAFTRAFAELNEVLSNGGELPRAWEKARLPERTEIYPVKELLGDHEVLIPRDTTKESGL